MYIVVGKEAHVADTRAQRQIVLACLFRYRISNLVIGFMLLSKVLVSIAQDILYLVGYMLLSMPLEIPQLTLPCR